MATTWYIDPIGGNDANAGNSFATRCRSFTGISSKSVAAGDSVRVIASPAYTDTGQTATWTDGSKTVTLTTAVTADITQATTAWTASASATSATSTSRKIGSASTSITMNAAFTTGLVAYLSLGSIKDFSAYQQISFWLMLTSGAMSADGDYYIALCSDTAGATVVNTFNIPRVLATGSWNCFTIDNGAALGSSIQSIALYRTQNRGSSAMLLNNILACKASSAVDSISLRSLISNMNSSTEGWWCIDSISGTTISLMQSNSADLNSIQAQGYSGTTGSAELYKREPIVLPSAIADSSISGANFGNFTKAGNPISSIIISGGWDTTSMSTQTGDTYLSTYNGLGQGIGMSGCSYTTWSNINLYKFGYNLNISSTCQNVTFTADNIAGGATYNVNCASVLANSNFNINNTIQSQFGFRSVSPLSYNSISIVNCISNFASGFIIAESSALDTTGTMNNNIISLTNVRRNGANTSNLNSSGFNISNGSSNNNITIGKCEYNIGQNLVLGNGSGSLNSNNKIKITSSLSNPIIGGSSTGSNIYISDGLNNSIDISGLTVTGGTYAIVLNGNGNNYINGGTINGTTAAVLLYNNPTLIFNNTTVSGTIYSFQVNSQAFEQGALYFQNYGTSTTDNRIYFNPTNFGSILTDTTIRHTSSGISWKMSCASTGNIGSPISSFPITLPISAIACNSGTLVTASVWVYRTSTSLTTSLICPGGQITGVSSDVVASASGAANTWEQLTITFTPTQQGVVKLYVQTYGAVASVYVDDFSVSQV